MKAFQKTTETTKQVLLRIILFFFKRKTIISILYILVIFFIKELAAYSSGDSIREFCNLMLENYNNGFSHVTFSFIKAIFSKGSVDVIIVTLATICFFSILKFLELYNKEVGPIHYFLFLLSIVFLVSFVYNILKTNTPNKSDKNNNCITSSPISNRNLTIGVLNFNQIYESNESNYDAGYIIYKRLKSNISEKKLNAEIFLIPCTYEEFDTSEIDNHFDLVIYGSIEANSCDSSSICLNYNGGSKITDIGIDNIDSEDFIFFKTSTRKLRAGHLQSNIDFIVNFFTGLLQFKEQNFESAIYYWDQVVTEAIDNGQTDFLYTYFSTKYVTSALSTKLLGSLSNSLRDNFLICTDGTKNKFTKKYSDLIDIIENSILIDNIDKSDTVTKIEFQYFRFLLTLGRHQEIIERFQLKNSRKIIEQPTIRLIYAQSLIAQDRISEAFNLIVDNNFNTDVEYGSICNIYDDMGLKLMNFVIEYYKTDNKKQSRANIHKQLIAFVTNILKENPNDPRLEFYDLMLFRMGIMIIPETKYFDKDTPYSDPEIAERAILYNTGIENNIPLYLNANTDDNEEITLQIFIGPKEYKFYGNAKEYYIEHRRVNTYLSINKLNLPTMTTSK